MLSAPKSYHDQSEELHTPERICIENYTLPGGFVSRTTHCREDFYHELQIAERICFENYILPRGFVLTLYSEYIFRISIRVLRILFGQANYYCYDPQILSFRGSTIGQNPKIFVKNL